MKKYYFEKPGVLSIDTTPRFDPERGTSAFWLGKIITMVESAIAAFFVYGALYLVGTRFFSDISADSIHWIAAALGLVTLVVILGGRQDGLIRIEFNFDTGIVTEVSAAGGRTDHGIFAEIDRIVLREQGEIFQVNRNYVIVWKDRFKPVLCISPRVYKPERLDLFREEIAPRLEAILSEYRAAHPEETPIQRNPPIQVNLQPDECREEFFTFDGWSFRRCIWSEIAIVLVVCLGLGAWLVLGEYGWAATTALSALFFGSLALFYYLDKVVLITPCNRTLSVLSGFGARSKDFDFQQVRRLGINRIFGVMLVTMVLAGGREFNLGLTCDMEKAKRIVEETGQIMGIDPYDILMFSGLS